MDDVLLPVKPHKYSREVELYCYNRFCEARKKANRNAELFWMNCHMIEGDLAFTEIRELRDHAES